MSSNHRKYISLIPQNGKRSNVCAPHHANSFKTISQCYNHNIAVKRDNAKYNSVNISNDSNNNIRNNISKSFFYEKLFRSTSHIKKQLDKIHMSLYNEDSEIKNRNVKQQNKNSFRINAKTSKNFKDAFGINGINNSKAYDMFVNQIQTNSSKRIFQYNKVINSINQQLLCKKCNIKSQDNNVINNDDEINLDKTAFSSNSLSKTNSHKNITQQIAPCKSTKLVRSNSFVSSASSNINSKQNNLKTKNNVTNHKRSNANKINSYKGKDKGTNNHIETCSVFGFVDEKNVNEREFPLGEDKCEKVNSFIDIKKGLLGHKNTNHLVVKNCKGKKIVSISNNKNSKTVLIEVKGTNSSRRKGKSADQKELMYDDDSKGNNVDKNSWGCNMLYNVFKCGKG